MSELLHQALIICVSKYRSILCTVVIQQVVNPVDGLGTKLNPLASNEDDGADLERQIGVELSHDRGHSRDRGCTERLSATVLDSEVEERIGGGETTFWDERVVKQGLVVDLLGLPGNEPM